MQKELRKKIILKRKNFLPTLIIIFILATLLFALVYFTQPSGILVILFFILLFALLLFTFSLIFGNSRQGFITSTVLVIFMVLKVLGVGNILNFILLFGLGIIAEIYARFKNKN